MCVRMASSSVQPNRSSGVSAAQKKRTHACERECAKEEQEKEQRVCGVRKAFFVRLLCAVGGCVEHRSHSHDACTHSHTTRYKETPSTLTHAEEREGVCEGE